MEESRFVQFDALVCSAMKSVLRLKGLYMDKYRLSAAHTDCICRLAERPEGMTRMELAAAEEMDRAQVTRVMRTLTERGFVTESGSGEYKKRYRLTESGSAAAEEIQQTILNINRYVSEEIPEEEILSFYRTFARITEKLRRAADVSKAAEDEHTLPFRGGEA